MEPRHFLALALAVLVGTAPVPAQSVAAPSIQFEKVVHDFGKVRETDVLRHEFIITNIGKATLEVTDVRPGCPSCTTALPWDRKVEPAKTGKIPIEFRTRGFSGTVKKSVTVTCNDPARSVHTIYVQATVWKPVDVSPAYLYFVGVEGELTNETKVVRITSVEESITLDTPKSSDPNLKTEVKTLKPGKEYELQVVYSPSATNGQGTITIKTSSTNAPLLTVTTYAMPQPAVVTMPPSIRLPTALSPNYRLPVTIRNNSSKPIKVSDPAASAEGVTIETTEVQPGKLFTLNLSFATNFHLRDKPVELTVKTTHPRYPILRLPFIPAVTAATPQRAQ